jgi:hypothetical protein
LSIRYWAALATALATAASVDVSAELLAHDSHQEGVLPVVVTASLVLLGLCLTIALRAGRGDLVRYDRPSLATRALLAAASVAVTFGIIGLMEAYEMRFGELSALDPRSVYVEHAPVVLIGYVVVGWLVGRLVSTCLRAAAEAGALAAVALGRFLRVERGIVKAVPRRDAGFGARVSCRCQIVSLGARALRAPPGGQSSPRLLLT